MESEAMIITKVTHIYIMLLSAIISENMDKVDHYLDDNMTQMYREMIENNKARNVKQKYDQLNITNVKILSQSDSELLVGATVKYMDYLVDRRTGKFVCGNNRERTSRDVTLKFRKNKIDESRKIFRCQSCGSGLDMNATAICPHCGKPVGEQFSPLVLCEII